MDPAALLNLFDELTNNLESALSSLQDWSLTAAAHPGQYNHDVIADELIGGRLAAEGLAVLSEESGLVGRGPVTVVVDPIDGSTNASKGLPWYAASLCAVDEAGPLASLVANLATGERYRAIRGMGAEGSGRVLDGSRVEQLSEAVIAFSGLPPDRDRYGQARMYGAAALDLCAVATGRFDAYADLNSAHGVWDYLGAQLVLHECGIPIVDGAGRDLCVLDHGARRQPVAAATIELLDELLEMLADWAVIETVDAG